MPTASTTLYTAPAGKTAVVKRAVFSNSSGTLTASVEVAVIRAGANAMNLIASMAVLPGTQFIANELAGFVFAPGDAITGLSTQTGVVTCFINGYTVS